VWPPLLLLRLLLLLLPVAQMPFLQGMAATWQLHTAHH
jgi:hypothetical protein